MHNVQRDEEAIISKKWPNYLVAHHPAEAYFNGKETTYEVTYGEDDLVKSYKLIDFNQAFPKVKEQ